MRESNAFRERKLTEQMSSITMEKQAKSPGETRGKRERIDQKSEVALGHTRRKNEEAIALGTEEEEVGVEFDGNREHHCWTDRELFKDTGDF